MENSDTSSDRWTTTEALKTLFLSLAPDAEGRVSGTKIRAWVATRYAEALDTASLVDSWDEADTTKRGSLDEAEFLVFAAALEAAAARVAAKLAASSAADRTAPAPAPEAEGQTAAVDAACGGWDAPAAVSVLALVASCLVDDGEDGAWNARFLDGAAAALGCGAAPPRACGKAPSWGALLAPLRGARGGAARRKAARELASRVLERAATSNAFSGALEAAFLRSLLVAPVVAGGGAYDARQRVALQKAAGFLGFEEGWLRARERGLATALKGEQADDAETASTLATTAGPESNTDVALRYAKIGTAATAAGVVIGLTAGLAAPVLAAALAGSTVWGASSLVLFAGTYSTMFAATFGAAGAGLAGYRMRRRVAGLKDFGFHRAPAPAEQALTVCVAVAGSLREPTDYAEAYGAAPPADAPLRRRLRRFVQQRDCSSVADARAAAKAVVDAARLDQGSKRVIQRLDVTFGDERGAKRRESRVSKLVGKMYADQKGDDVEATAKELLELPKDELLDARPPADPPRDARADGAARDALAASVRAFVEERPAAAESTSESLANSAAAVAHAGADAVGSVGASLGLRRPSEETPPPPPPASPTGVVEEDVEVAAIVRVAAASARAEDAELAAGSLDDDDDDETEAEDAAAAAARMEADASRLRESGLVFDEAEAGASEGAVAREVEDQDVAKEEAVELVDASLDPSLWWWPELYAAGAPELNVLVWERDVLVDVTSSMRALAGSLAQSSAQDAIVYGAATTTVGIVLTSLLLPIALLQATQYIDSTWTLAVERADAAGLALADALCAVDVVGARPVTLVGYSLGARVVFKCLEELARRHERARSRVRRRLARLAEAAARDARRGGKALSEALDGATHALEGAVDAVNPLRPSTTSLDALDVHEGDDEDDLDDLDHLQGYLEVTPVDGVHWVDAAAGKKVQLAVRVNAARAMAPGDDLKPPPSRAERARRYASSSSKDGDDDAVALGGAPTAAACGDPIFWRGDRNVAARVRVDCLAKDAALDVGFCVPAKTSAVFGPTSYRAAAVARTQAWAEKKRWRAAASVVAGRCVNAYSENDLMLAIMYRTQSWSRSVAGIAPVNLPGVEDVDVSDDVASHAAYPARVRALLAKINLDGVVQVASPVDAAAMEKEAEERGRATLAAARAASDGAA
ncbi:hypothetical protein AURANDRAFT_60757 [Aureococcus anophagefferens]|uniref:EF-hand domain-containing protein n=1 Tax=Aureococcus anophagefferens TaxID=44056 RepID=F0XW86_AURAN|nr:hypothetical protein AURANDRAFT_60757 [Aureococcus anophagefferens]EGB12731.1 hypothetical protein AURANDRAFT_60757 [Aureococcus anophagefferens]|eukprot:XP_009032380.1 hypothetical protein AURANDRAFT_60757 [Aureococcus anophagefferens]